MDGSLDSYKTSINVLKDSLNYVETDLIDGLKSTGDTILKGLNDTGNSLLSGLLDGVGGSGGGSGTGTKKPVNPVKPQPIINTPSPSQDQTTEIISILGVVSTIFILSQ